MRLPPHHVELVHTCDDDVALAKNFDGFTSRKVRTGGFHCDGVVHGTHQVEPAESGPEMLTHFTVSEPSSGY
jgi:hypothetical protein